MAGFHSDFSDYSAVAAALATHAGLQLHEFSIVNDLLFFVVANLGLFIYLKDTPTYEGLLVPLQLRLNLIYILTLLLSIGIYRRFFHRLSHFPGPVGASLSKFWAFSTVYEGRYFQSVKELHDKHGDFVRVGPRELDVCNLSAINAVFGSTTPCRKGSWYDGTHMGDSSAVHIEIDKSLEGHAWKRRIWDVALASKSLREYEPRVLDFVNELISSLRRESAKGPVDIGMFFSFFTFDVMGDLAFGESFHMLEDGKSHDYMKIVQGYAHTNALVCTIPWIASIFPWLPKLEAVKSLYRFARERVNARMPHGSTPTDIFSYLLKEDRVSKRKYTQKELNIECVALVIGALILHQAH